MALRKALILRRLAKRGLEGRRALIQQKSEFLPSLFAFPPYAPVVRIVHPPADNILPGFPLVRKVQGKTRFPGGIRRRWRDPDGKIYEWDYQHGRVEVYDRHGRHLGEFDPVTGAQVNPAIPGRRVEP